MNNKLYIITRADLDPGAQAAQSCHAMRAFAAAYPEEERRWYATSNNLVVLAAENEEHLRKVLAKLVENRIPVACFREPDFGDQLTAIASSPDGARYLSALPLALKITQAA